MRETLLKSMILAALTGRLLTLHSHGRDNKVQVYDLRSISTFPTQSSVTGPCEAPAPLHSIDTNALGYCKCDVLEISSSEALIAVPSTLDDNLADIFHFPSCKRRHRSIGKGAFESKTGTIMALSMVQRADDLDLIIAYESGKVAVFRHAESLQHKESVWLEEGNGWQLISESHQHKEPSGSSTDTL